MSSGADPAAAASPPPSKPTDAQLAVLRRFELERRTAAVCRYLTEAGVTSLVLKGPAIARELWPDEPRDYGDADLLVGAQDFDRAEAALRAHGYVRTAFAEPAGTAVEYRAPDPLHISVDLHRSFRHVGVPADRCWALLTAEARRVRLPGGEVLIPSRPALAVIVTLHAIWHGTEIKPRTADDLRRALERFDDAEWRRAAELAAALGSLEAFTAGLFTAAEGQALADRMALAPPTAPEFRLRLGERPETSLEWLDLLTTRRPPREVARRLMRELVPSADEMRRQDPQAQAGRLALASSYIRRLLRLTRTAPRGIVAARRALKSNRIAGAPASSDADE